MKNMMCLIMAASTIAASANAAPKQSASPLLGTWKLDVSRMPVSPEERPKAVTITYSDAGQDRWRTTVEIIGSDDTPIRADGIYPLDGTAVPSKGYPGLDMLATRIPAPNVMVSAFYKDQMPRSTRTYVVAPDGNTMTETVIWTNLNGRPAMQTFQFNRAR